MPPIPPREDLPKTPIGQRLTYEDVDPYTADHRDYVLSQSRVNLMVSSQMADLKANLILTLAAVMLQFGLLRITDAEHPGHHAALWAVVLGSIITIVLCGVSTIPKASFDLKKLRDDEQLPGTFTLLFFGSYTHISKARYKELMHRTLSSPPRTHDAILDELYSHGQFLLRKKFLPLRLAYITFLATWLVSAVLFLFG
jgi:hypothetical protein